MMTDPVSDIVVTDALGNRVVVNTLVANQANSTKQTEANDLLAAIAPADAQSLPVNGDAVDVTRGKHNWLVYGTWDGASAYLRYRPSSDDAWITVKSGDNITPVLLSADGWIQVSLMTGEASLEIQGAGGMTSLASIIEGI